MMVVMTALMVTLVLVLVMPMLVTSGWVGFASKVLNRPTSRV